MGTDNGCEVTEIDYPVNEDVSNPLTLHRIKSLSPPGCTGMGKGAAGEDEGVRGIRRGLIPSPHLLKNSGTP